MENTWKISTLEKISCFVQEMLMTVVFEDVTREKEGERMGYAGRKGNFSLNWKDVGGL